MSKEIYRLVCELKHHASDLQANIKAVVDNNRQLSEFVGKPKYDLILQALPIFEAKVKYHKSQIEKFSKQLSEHQFKITDDFDEWLS